MAIRTQLRRSHSAPADACQQEHRAQASHTSTLVRTLFDLDRGSSTLIAIGARPWPEQQWSNKRMSVLDAVAPQTLTLIAEKTPVAPAKRYMVRSYSAALLILG